VASHLQYHPCMYSFSDSPNTPILSLNSLTTQSLSLNTYTYAHTHTHIHTHTFIPTHIHTYTHVCTHAHSQYGLLTSRTLLERTIEEVFYNKYASRLVMKAARDTTAEHPFLRLPSKEGPIIQSMAFSQVSSTSSYGYLRAASGLPVTRDWYVFGITCEKDHSILLKKIRILLIKEDLLKEMATSQPPPFESSLRVRVYVWMCVCVCVGVCMG
jgi:hypothetical protein